MEPNDPADGAIREGEPPYFGSPTERLPSHRGHALAAIARTAILVGAWLPFFALVIFLLPRFEPIFNKLQDKGELPGLTTLMIYASQVQFILFVWLPFFAVLILCDVGMARATGRQGRGRALYRTWFAALILLALSALLLAILALLMPVFKMSSAVN
jgi:hypothetical protein